VLELRGLHVHTLPGQALTHLRELKLEIEESLSDAACAALCQLCSLEMFFLSYSNEYKSGPLPIRHFDLRGLRQLRMAGLHEVAAKEFKLPPACIFVFDGVFEDLQPILQDVRANLHNVHSRLRAGVTGTDALRPVCEGRLCQFLTLLTIKGGCMGTLQQPVVIQASCLRVLHLVADDALHVSMQGVTPRILELRSAHWKYPEMPWDAEHQGDVGRFSLRISDAAAVASSLEEMQISYRNYCLDPPSASVSLLGLLDKRPAEVNTCGAFRNPLGTTQVVYQFIVECKDVGMVRSMSHVDYCRACRWGVVGHGPFWEYSYFAKYLPPLEDAYQADGELKEWRARNLLRVDFNDMCELQSQMHALGCEIIPGFALPAD
jgi:hypothetical protein